MEDPMNMRITHTFGHAAVSSPLLRLCVVMAISLSLNATLAWAQSTSTGTISGQVTDEQNAVVSGADVILLDVATNAERKTVTNDTGRYTFVNVPPGIYDISV